MYSRTQFSQLKVKVVTRSKSDAWLPSNTVFQMSSEKLIDTTRKIPFFLNCLYVFARKIKYHASYHKMRRLLYYKMLQPFFQNAQVITKRVVSTHCHKTTNWKKGQPRSLKTNFISTIDTPKLIMNGPLNHYVLFSTPQ